MNFRLSLLALGLSFLAFSACDSDDDNTPNYEVPSTYTFENVNYEGQTQRIGMLSEMKAYLGSANTGSSVDANRLKAMYGNQSGAGFSGSYSKDIRSKTFPGVANDFDLYIDRLAALSGTSEVAAPGKVGIATAANGRTYLLDSTGLEWVQVVEKGLMAACFGYQAATVYLGEEKMSVDNNDITPGEGTAMEHHWDESFGYLGVNPAFPSVSDDALFWGSYCNRRDPLMGTNSIALEYRKGRAAISNKDMEGRDRAITEIRKQWARISAGTAINYLNGALAAGNDTAKRMHDLSEGVVFIYALQFMKDSGTPRESANELLRNLAGSENFFEMNLYNTSDEQIRAAREVLSTRYELAEVKERL